MIATQLTLDLWQALASAQAAPERTDIFELMQVLDAAVAELPQHQRLLYVAEAFLQIAEIYAERAKWLLASGSQTLSPDVLLPVDFLNELVRQSTILDLQDLLVPLPPRKDWERDLDSSGVEDALSPSVEAEAFYQVERLEADNGAEEFTNQISKEEHAENVSDWIAAIAAWFNTEPVECVNLRELCNQIDLDLVQVWMAVLIGGFPIQQHGAFYDMDAIMVWSQASASLV